MVAFPYFVTCAVVVTISILGFLFASVLAEADTESILSVSKPSCTWRTELGRGNPFGCFAPSFRKVRTTIEPNVGTCEGPLVDHLYDEHAGDDKLLSFGEAATLSVMVKSRISKSQDDGTCGHHAKDTKAHACFAHATVERQMGKNDASKFVTCIIGEEPPSCRKAVCASRS